MNLASSAAPPSPSPHKKAAAPGHSLRLRAEPDDVVASSAAVPRPDQIFDFHPKGSAPETWREPFVVDANDGPLANYVRQTAKELRDFKAAQAQPRQGPEAAPAKEARHRVLCGTTDPQNPPCPRVQADGSPAPK